MCCVGRLRKRCLVSVSVPLLMLSFLTGPAESSRVRARAFPLRFSASASGSDFHRHPPPPNNSFKPTPHRGVNSVLCATLHAVATPLRGGLTQALGPMSEPAGGLIILCAVTTTCAFLTHWRVHRFVIASIVSAFCGSAVFLALEILQFGYFPSMPISFLLTFLVTAPIALIVGCFFVLQRRKNSIKLAGP